MAKTIEKLMIWDGNNHFRRCAGNKGLMRLTFKGKPTGAIHGTIKRILTDIQAFKPTECAVVFDGAGARVEKQKVYEGYKAHRTNGMDESLHYQMNVTRDILRAAGICVLQKPGVDADDAIGALASLKHRSILVNSNDKDFLSLVNDWCSQIRDRGNGPEVWTAASVRDHYGIEPHQIPDYLALCGDGVDGIPGLSGCGPVNAGELLREWGSLREIVVNRKQIPKWNKKLAKQRDELKAFLQLTTLDTSVISDAAMQNIIPRLKPGKYSPELTTLCETHGLHWLLKWFLAHRPSVVSSTRGLWG